MAAAKWQWKSSLSKADGDPTAWTDFNAADTASLEAAWTERQDGRSGLGLSDPCDLGATHAVDFSCMRQYRKDDPNRRRPVRRNGPPVNSPKRKRDADDADEVQSGRARQDDESGGSAGMVADPGYFYFLSLIPDEDNGDYDDENIDYDVKLKKVDQSVVQWFKALCARFNQLAEDGNEDGAFETIDESLGCNVNHFNLTDDDDLFPRDEKLDELNTIEKLFAYWEAENSCEGEKKATRHAFRYLTTLEFDYAYAFFLPGALRNNELGEHLQPLVTLADDGTVTLTQHRIRKGSYLS